VKYFTGEWDRITAAAGCPGLLFHDLRRSAVRGMIRAGVTEHVAMKISGHLTSEVFRRYNIISGKDLADAAAKLEISYRQAKAGDAQEIQSQTIQ
jgi:integrase